MNKPKPSRRDSRRRLNIETLESRKLLAVTLVEDLNLGNAVVTPTNLTVVGSQAFFVATDQNGAELWKTDGTVAGTSLVKDIYSGAYSSSPRNLVNVGGTLYFTAFTPASGLEIWKSDGTAAGTVLLKEIGTGNSSAYAYELTNVGGSLYFSKFNNTNAGYEIWKSNGTSDGTTMVHSFGADSTGVTSLMQAGSLVYFLHSTAANGTELWATDGTSVGTALVRDIRIGPASSSITQMTASGGRLYFVANNGSSGYEVWRSDGTFASTVVLRDLELGSASSNPSGLTDLNGTLYFSGTNSAQGGRELYRSSASTANRVKDINPGTGSSNPANLVNVNGMLFFSASNGTAIGTELWKSDGTDAGTMLVKDIAPTFSSYPSSMTRVGNTLYFVATDPLNGAQSIWKSDGTTAGTLLVKDLQSIAAYSNIGTMAGSSNTLWFTVSGSFQLWSSDGTNAGTQPVTNLIRTQSSSPSLLSAGVNKLAFFASENLTNGLFLSDGTAVGTNLVVQGTGAQTKTVQMGSFFFYSGYSAANGYELWKTDGTVAGTSLVKDANAGPNGSYPTDLTVVGNKLFFIADNGALGRELWVSDGSTGGTALVKNIRLGIQSSNPQELTNFNGNLYFTADSSVSGNDRELYKSDGTLAGTDKLFDILSTGSANPVELTEVNGKLYFVATGAAGREIWATDGTPTGTQIVSDLAAEASSSSPEELTRVGNQLYFVANDGSPVGREIWKTDGTNAGTLLVANIETGGGYSSYASKLTAVGNKLYFVAYSNSNSIHSLWTSDGTAAGTVQVADLAPSADEAFANLTQFAGQLLFTASDTSHGNELWISDGTSIGTRMLKDIWNSAKTSSSPASLTPLGDQLFFTADDGNLGIELWKFTVPLVAASAATVDAFEGTVATNSGTLKYSSTIAASYGTVVNNGNGTWSWSGAAPDGPASLPVTITVTDIDGLTATTAFTVSVTNVAPQLSVNANTVSANEGSIASNSGTVVDPGVDTFTLSASLGTVVNNGNGTWSWSLTTLDGNALDTVTITATDSDGAVNTVVFNVQTFNAPPLIAAGAAAVSVGESLVATMNGTVSDPGVDTVGLTVSFGSIVDNGNGTWSWATPTNDGPDQSQVITVTATDSDGAVSTTTFGLIVQNLPPAIAPVNATVTVNEGTTATNTGTVSDPGLDTISLIASFGAVVNNNNGTWSWSAPTTDGPDQSQTVTIAATDSDSSTSSTTFVLQVVNVAPVVSAATATVIVNEGATATQTGTFGDVGADTVALSASFGVINVNVNGTWSWSANTNDGPDQSQIVTISATDSDGASGTTTFQLQVNNVAPVIAVNAASISVNEGAAATNGGTTSDVGLDTISLTASFGAVVNNNDGTWSWSGTPADGPDNSQTVTITATDSDGASSSTAFLLSVQNVAPSVGVGNSTVTVHQAVTTTNSGTYTDPGVDTVTLTLTPSDFGTLTNNGNGTWSWSYYSIALLTAPVLVTVTATDSDGATSNTTFTAQPGDCSTQVLNTADSGDGSLRAALSCSNSRPGSQTVSFSISGPAPYNISLLSALPAVTDTSVIDASTQSGYVGSPLVFVDGLNVPGTTTDGLRIQAANVSVIALSIGGFAGDGIEVSGVANALLRHNYLGLNAAGQAAGNRSFGLRLNGSTNARVDGNVISNNTSSGVIISGAGVTANTLINNRIGTNPAGSSAMPNKAGGILIQSAGNNIGLPAAGNTISGNTGSGLVISVAAAANNVLQGNRIGTRSDGNAALPNSSYGVLVRSAGNKIGGDRTLGEGNLLSGNRSHGLVLSGATGNLVEGNLIGTNLLGDLAVPNGSFGVYLAGASNNTIGNLATGKGNIISGNNQSGVILSGATTSGNTVQGNRIGTTADGLADLGNGGNGINLRAGARSNQVNQNVISGNAAAGVSITEPTTRLNSLKGNLIGVNALGTTAIGNATFGILLKSPDNTIGGTALNEGNTIAGSTRGIALSDATATGNVISGNKIGGPTFPPMPTGIFISLAATKNTIGPANEIAFNTVAIRSSTGGVGNRFTQNSIHDNSTIGIDLGTAGPTANDIGDADTGANLLQNWPIVTSPVSVSGNDLIISFSVSSTSASASFPLTIEFFKDNGSGQGSVYLGSNVYTAADQLIGLKSITLPGAALLAGNGSFLTATATDSNGNTSEFSATATVGSLPALRVSQRPGARSPYDVSADGQVSPLDALAIIQILHSSARVGTAQDTSAGIVKGDVNGDRKVTPLDALLVIDWLKSSTKPDRIVSDSVPGEIFDLDLNSDKAEGESFEPDTVVAIIDSFYADYGDVDTLAKRRSR